MKQAIPAKFDLNLFKSNTSVDNSRGKQNKINPMI
jgi:hypothetical protein